jgi:fumarate reductase subunit D
MRRNDARARGHAGYVTFVVHRLSGLALALFLPLHFFALSRALNGAAALDGFLAWTAHPLVKVAETGLVLALALHLAGGLRLLFAEFVAWRADGQKTAIAAAAGVGIACALLFAFNL